MKLLLFSAVLLSGLVSGLFYSYSCSVNMGLKSLADSEYIKAMQAINIAIQNPYFFISFMGLLLIYPVAIYQLYQKPVDISFYCLLTATIIYFIGVFGVTIFFNVPLNEQLAKFSVTTASPDDIASMRKIFERPWNNYHTVRMLSSILSFALSILSILKQKI